MARPDPNGATDLGVMQVNTIWNPALAAHAGAGAAWNRQLQIEDPCFNIAASALIRRALYRAGRRQADPRKFGNFLRMVLVLVLVLVLALALAIAGAAAGRRMWRAKISPKVKIARYSFAAANACEVLMACLAICEAAPASRLAYSVRCDKAAMS